MLGQDMFVTLPKRNLETFGVCIQQKLLLYGFGIKTELFYKRRFKIFSSFWAY